MNFPFRHAFCCIVSGPTQSGKTEWAKKFVALAPYCMSEPPEKIYWCYSEWQPSYNDMIGDVKFVQGLPDASVFKKDDGAKLLIVDDMMQSMKNDPNLANVFIKGSHHWGLSCIHLVQNIFFEGLRTNRINAQYLVLMKNPNDQLQVNNLAKQIFPNDKSKMTSAYEEATKEPHGYLLVDLHQYTPDEIRLRTNIFTPYQTVFAPKNYVCPYYSTI